MVEDSALSALPDAATTFASMSTGNQGGILRLQLAGDRHAHITKYVTLHG